MISSFQNLYRFSRENRANDCALLNNKKRNKFIFKPKSYNYEGTEGPVQKATIEKVFKLDSESKDGRLKDESPPWNFGWQMNERNTVWTDDLKSRLIKTVLCRDLGTSEKDLDERLSLLDTLLPGLGDQLVKAPPKLLLQILSDIPALAELLLNIKLQFPKADVLSLVSNDLNILVDPTFRRDLAKNATSLRAMLPDVDVDTFVENFPCVLDIQSLENALEVMENEGNP
uniref:Uncharacterized protein n=1 Tax=Polytomella parva TaxID=51329 RepID=A0A7S0VS63_9CHLO|mmetsp:Transcript_9384/g.17589  ORF Transcript_9384/g.17589 Transcript_9384/m.17589 type:complete len:229 (+) Transcript_9384:98-784(+)